MRFLFPLIMLMPFFAHAGWWSSFCEKYIATEDPYPFAEYDYVTLIDAYFRTQDGRMLDEIIYRLRAGMLTTREREYFWLKFRP